MTDTIYDLKLKAFKETCSDKKYQVQESSQEHGTRLEIADTKNRVIVIVYYKGTVLIQGKNTPLKHEMEKFREQIESSPAAITALIKQAKACSTRYDIMLDDLREKIKDSLNTLGVEIEIENNPNANIQYRATLKSDRASLTMTQYQNGTLMLQGKEDSLYSDTCDLIEKIASPTDKEVVARFISSNEESLKLFSERYTPELTATAEVNVKKQIGDAFDFLQPYDKKYFVAAETLSLTEIPLPEYSPIVMPASKAFEGLAKRLVVAIGLYPSEPSDFSILNDRKNPTRTSVCQKEKHCDTLLSDLSVKIKTYRHFMMHSDDSKITKVDTYEEAKEKLAEIYKESKRFFDYFNDVFKLLP